MKTIVNFVKTLFTISIFVIGVFCIVGTGGDGGDNSGDNRSSLSRIDISGAKALVIASKNTAGSASIRAGQNNPDKVYKLTEDGLVIEVKFYDESGNEVSSELYYPEYIEDINDDYVFMKFGNNIQPNHYIVNKSTGSAFQMENWITTYVDVLGRQHYFHSEASGDTFDGNAYYLSQNEPLFTFSLRQIKFNPNGILTDTRVSAKGDNITHNEAHGPMTAIAPDGTILYKLYNIQIGHETRLIANDGRVVDLLSEIITNQPEMKQFLLGEIPGYIGGFGEPFVGTDGGIYFINHKLMHYRNAELYIMPDNTPLPPDPIGPAIDVYTETGLPYAPYNPDTLQPVNLRNPIEVVHGVPGESFGYTFPDDWGWYPDEYASTFQTSHLTDEGGDYTGESYDEHGNMYHFNWHPGQLYSPVWRLNTGLNGAFRLEPYGGSMATNSSWLASKAPNDILYCDPTLEEQWEYWDEIGNLLFLRCSGKTIAIEVKKGLVYETNNLGQKAIPVYASSEILSEVQDAEATEDYYYLLGRTRDEAQISLYRFSAGTHSAFKLIDGSEYELYAFTVTDDNTVAFKAVRKLDGASIGGTINLDGEITIIEAIQDRNIVQLVRVL